MKEINHSFAVHQVRNIYLQFHQWTSEIQLTLLSPYTATASPALPETIPTNLPISQLCHRGLVRGLARTQVPTTRNYTLELPTFVVIARVNPSPPLLDRKTQLVCAYHVVMEVMCSSSCRVVLSTRCYAT